MFGMKRPYQASETVAGDTAASDADQRERSVGQPLRKRVVKRPTGGSLLLIIGVVMGLTILVPTVQRVIAQRQEIAQIERDISQANEDIQRIKADNARWDDPAYVKAEARGRLLFVQPGDTTYVVIGADKYRTADVPVDLSPQVHETKADPVALYVDSLIGADQAGAASGPIDGKQDTTTDGSVSEAPAND